MDDELKKLVRDAKHSALDQKIIESLVDEDQLKGLLQKSQTAKDPQKSRKKVSKTKTGEPNDNFDSTS